MLDVVNGDGVSRQHAVNGSLCGYLANARRASGMSPTTGPATKTMRPPSAPPHFDPAHISAILRTAVSARRSMKFRWHKGGSEPVALSLNSVGNADRRSRLADDHLRLFFTSRSLRHSAKMGRHLRGRRLRRPLRCFGGLDPAPPMRT